MNRLTRLVQPSQLARVAPLAHRHFRHPCQIHVIRNSFSHSPSFNPRRFTPLTTVEIPISSPAMEMDSPPPPETDIPPTEDFVQIEDPSDMVRSLYESVHSAAGDSTADADTSSDQRVELPEELSERVIHLTCDSSVVSGTCDVYLVGTAHVSQVYHFAFN